MEPAPRFGGGPPPGRFGGRGAARGLRGGFGGPGPNGSSTAGQVAAYVQQFAATTVGGATVYDLTTPISQ